MQSELLWFKAGNSVSGADSISGADNVSSTAGQSVCRCVRDACMCTSTS